MPGPVWPPQTERPGARYAPTAARETTANGDSDTGTAGAAGSLSAQGGKRSGFQLHKQAVRTVVLRGQWPTGNTHPNPNWTKEKHSNPVRI